MKEGLILSTLDFRLLNHVVHSNKKISKEEEEDFYKKIFYLGRIHSLYCQ